MHDPLSVAWEIVNPFNKNKLITIWHVDPCHDGTDDSCGRYLRDRHGNKDTLNRIIRRFESEFKDLFDEECQPKLSTIAIGLNLFSLAAWEHFNHNDRKTKNFMRKYLYEIMIFTENTIDSLHPSINSSRQYTRYYAAKRGEKINEFSYIVYGWILRATRPWYKHPKYHIHHWQIQFHAWQVLRRYLFSKCKYCGKHFRYGEGPITDIHNSPKPKIFKSELNVYHKECYDKLIKESIK
jgi:hypothetical protein